MGSASSFGRRANPQRTEQKPLRVQNPVVPLVPVPSARAAPSTARAEPLLLTAADALSPDIDRELEEWKRARGMRIPWRQISLIASLSFGIAWFVLPDSVSDPVSWVLLGLSGASFVNGVAPRRNRHLAGDGAAGADGTKEPAAPGNSTGLS